MIWLSCVACSSASDIHLVSFFSARSPAAASASAACHNPWIVYAVRLPSTATCTLPTSAPPDEVLHLIFFELNDPNPLTQVSKRFHTFSRDPYVRARYFLARYGPIEALYFAFARGRLMTERVIDVRAPTFWPPLPRVPSPDPRSQILLASGAHMSRYLVQIAIHHYFYTHSHFIKGTWVRNVPLRVFTYFLSIAERRYGEVPRGKVCVCPLRRFSMSYSFWRCRKNDDDGSLFVAFLKESRFPSEMKSVNWETIRDILQTYKVYIYCHRDSSILIIPSSSCRYVPR